MNLPKDEKKNLSDWSWAKSKAFWDIIKIDIDHIYIYFVWRKLFAIALRLKP